MLLVHYPTAFKALDNFIDSFNSKADKYATRIRVGATLTARELVRLYGVSFLKAKSLSAVDLQNLPSLETNNQQLAKLVKCSARSIQRYLIKLQRAGVIQKRKFHGSNSNFELWLNPSLLGISHKTADTLQAAIQQKAQTKSQDAAIDLSNLLPSCRHTYPGNTGTLKNKLIEVESVENSELPENSGNISGNTRKIAQAEAVKCRGEKGSAAAPPSETRKIASRVGISELSFQELSDPTRDNFHLFYVNLFWLTARNLIYKDRDLVDSQIAIAKKLITKLYDPVPQERIDAIHKMYIERLTLVAKYLKKNPKRFVPLPYIYFNTENPNGFVGTKKWHQAFLRRKKEVQLELALSRAIRKFTSNEIKPPIERNPPLKVFRECENTLGKLGDPSLVERFHAAVLEHHTFKAIH